MMRGRLGHLTMVLALGMFPRVEAWAQTALTWAQVRDKFAAVNPTLQSAQLNIDESRAAEITAYLRPNPDLSLTVDGFQPTGAVWRPLSGVLEVPGIKLPARARA